MFLNPTAKPTPRRTPSPRVVLPAPPGSRIASRGSSSARGPGARPRGGSPRRPAASLRSAGRSAARRRARARSAAAARPGRARAPRRACPSAPRRRSTPARRRSRASRRRAGCSCRRTSTRSARSRRRTGRTRTGGVRRHGGRAGRVRAAVEQDPHPHETSRPSRRAMLGPDLRRVPVHVADERLLAVVDHLHRRSVCSASSALWICIERSSRPPNAPPTPARWMRTARATRSRHGAT